jgi:hypothetical protein
MADPQYLSTDPYVGVSVADAQAQQRAAHPSPGGYLSTDPDAGTPAPAPDRRSLFARGVDAVSEPTRIGKWIERQSDALADWIQPPSKGEPVDPRAAFGAGAVQGAGRVVSSFTSPLGIAAALSGVGAERAGASGLVNAARALRAVEATSGAAFGARGVEQAATAPDWAGTALGVAQAAGGALGVRGGVQGLMGPLRPIEAAAETATRPIAGALRPAPGFFGGAGALAPSLLSGWRGHGRQRARECQRTGPGAAWPADHQRRLVLVRHADHSRGGEAARGKMSFGRAVGGRTLRENLETLPL